MQLLIIAGNVGKDAVLRRAGEDDVLNFSLAVSNGKDRDGNDRPATWYDCALWGKRASSLERHITKGTKLVLHGRPTGREHDGKVYLGITVDQLEFMGSAQRRDDDGRDSRRDDRRDDRGRQSGGGYGGGRSDMDDSIPFSPEWRG